VVFVDLSCDVVVGFGCFGSDRICKWVCEYGNLEMSENGWLEMVEKWEMCGKGPDDRLTFFECLHFLGVSSKFLV
jgi:hypothetical protein